MNETDTARVDQIRPTDDEEFVWCTDECPDDCMADHQGEE